MRVFVHVTISSERGSRSLCAPEIAPVLWRSLVVGFPEAIAALIMDTHVHLLTGARRATGEDERRRLGRIAGGVARRASIDALRWRPASTLGAFVGPDKVRRQLRYVVLNPCRAKLVRDPLAWRWSSHRDVMGAVVEPWIDVARVASATGWHATTATREALHRYVSADPSAHVGGTPPPAAASPARISFAPLVDVRDAALSCVRASPAALSRAGAAREVFVALALHVGWCRVALLAEVCRVSQRTMRRCVAAAGPPPAAALLCLGDVRLRDGIAEDGSRAVHLGGGYVA